MSGGGKYIPGLSVVFMMIQAGFYKVIHLLSKPALNIRPHSQISELFRPFLIHARKYFCGLNNLPK